jgi:hypothetical protein
MAVQMVEITPASPLAKQEPGVTEPQFVEDPQDGAAQLTPWFVTSHETVAVNFVLAPGGTGFWDTFAATAIGSISIGALIKSVLS